MKNALKYIVVSVCSLILAACAGVNFNRPQPGKFQLGRSTQNEIVKEMGDSYKATNMTKNGKAVKAISYGFSAVQGGSDLRMIPVRVQTFFFYNNTLVGQTFISSFDADNTNFDPEKASTLKKGQSTHSDVIALLGEPSGTYIPPMSKALSKKTISYQYTARRTAPFGKIEIERKSLSISFNENDVIEDIELSLSNN
ncbi:hypothetical protein SAMN06265795_11926 [Noviherbaspirillum humi]|uniref:Beta-barrel assembly machine subunit BamE n=1 Tax=Noviherbaspirillum humi TaxID=1688639 RepID=A0A239L5F7_9BURK|nr:hypothetical protein [Noviherbaspirillum humi]SNT24919.1 hypothetical protein SAMN06265795_11926 [Noviherbaspirillum humi]